MTEVVQSNQVLSGNGIKLGVLTSGGDAQGMNAAVRAVARTALVMGARPFAIREGWAGAVAGGDQIQEMTWKHVSSILNQGGTVIGTARCKEFRTRDGLRVAAKNLVQLGIDRLVVIGGDGSLSGTEEFRQEWPSLLQELVERGEISPETAAAHPALMVAGLVGSIDNDLVGTDMTIGADSALHRIFTAIDEIASTAASHQRTFVVEVMGRNCGYLPLMAAVGGGCDYVLIPEHPPVEGWEDEMCAKLQLGRDAGRRDSIVLVAEGAKDRSGNPITSQYVAQVLDEKMNADARVTILGHVQRGGSPSAYDRWMSTLLGYAAAQEVIKARPEDRANILGVRHNRIATIPMTEAIEKTRAVRGLMESGDYEAAVAARGASFTEMLAINEKLSTPPTDSDLAITPPTAKRVAIIHCGGLAPGMNTAARAAVRFGLQEGFDMLGVQGSFQGLADGDIRDLRWEDVEGWGFTGGAELGTRRPVPQIEQFYAIGRALENHRIDGLLVIGGYNAYLAIKAMAAERDRYPAFQIPMILIPASIDNNLPGSELSIGADTALNNAVWALDRIKESAAASKRCFVAESMGRNCGYLALMSGIASGAELVYLEEENVTLDKINEDAHRIRTSFEKGRRLCLVVRNEMAGQDYDLDFMARVFEQEGGGSFDVRSIKIGHLQQGGNPSPFDRLLATRYMHRAVAEMARSLQAGDRKVSYLGLYSGDITFHPIENMDSQVDSIKRRPREQWWLDLRPVIHVVSDPAAPPGAAMLPIWHTEA